MEYEFWLLVAFSVLAPTVLFSLLVSRRAISRPAVLAFGIALILLAGVDVVLLQRFSMWARLSPSALDDYFFASEVAVALYLLPVVLAGIGVNLVSHILVRHLTEAERRFDDAAQDRANDRARSTRRKR